jgi:hypothetical protein
MAQASMRTISRTNIPRIPLLKKLLIVFLLLVFVPIAASAVRYFCLGDGRANWQTADRSSAGLLPRRIPTQTP